MSHPVSLNTQTQTRPPPSVDAARVPDRVQALDHFLQQELLPKVLRLREEHQSIDQQLQRTTTTSAASKPNQAQRLKQQAWLWKRTSKRQELNRIEPFLELATDLQTLSKDLNPNLLRFTLLWQQSHAGATNTGYRGRHEKGQRLSRDYDDACRENAELSKSIQARMDRLIPPTSTTSKNNNNKEDASIVNSLRIFCNNNVVCGTCQAMFHKDYLNALVVPAPNDHTTTAAAAAPAFVCFQCWRAKARGQRQETDDLFAKAFCTENFVVKPQDEETTSTTNTNDNKENNTLPSPPTTTSSSQIQKHPMHESERWKARKAVIKNRMVAAAAATATAKAPKGKSSSRAGADNRSVATDASTVDDSVKSKDSPSVASKAFDHYIDSMSTLDDGLLRIGKSMSKCSKFVLGDIGKGSRKLPPLLHHLSAYDESTRTNRLDAMKLQMNSSAAVVVVDTNKDAKRKPNESQPNRSWSRYGSSTSSICSNSIVESEGSFNSRLPSDSSSTTRYEMSDGSLVQQLPVKRNDDGWNRVSSPDSSMCSGSSLFSDSSTDASLLTFLTVESSSEPNGRKFLKSAMKTKKASTIASSTSRASPTKVQDFPLGSSSSSHSRKSVRFRSPLTECKVFNPMAADNSNKALLDTSADIMDHMKYFCKWETFLNPFEQKAA